MAGDKLVAFDGACPFLMCRKTGPHSHGICGTCGAARWGNISCPECWDHAPDSVRGSYPRPAAKP